MGVGRWVGGLVDRGAGAASAAISHFAVVVWRLTSCPDTAGGPTTDAEAAQLRYLHDWALEFILTCREYGIALDLPSA